MQPKELYKRVLISSSHLIIPINRFSKCKKGKKILKDLSKCKLWKISQLIFDSDFTKTQCGNYRWKFYVMTSRKTSNQISFN